MLFYDKILPIVHALPGFWLYVPDFGIVFVLDVQFTEVVCGSQFRRHLTQ